MQETRFTPKTVDSSLPTKHVEKPILPDSLTHFPQCTETRTEADGAMWERTLSGPARQQWVNDFVDVAKPFVQSSSTPEILRVKLQMLFEHVNNLTPDSDESLVAREVMFELYTQLFFLNKAT